MFKYTNNVFQTFFIVSAAFLSSLTAAGQQLPKKQLLIHAQQMIAEDFEIQNSKSQNKFILKHPKFTLHDEVQTIRFDQIYIEQTSEIKRKEWRVIGGDVQVHYYQKNKKFILDPRIYDFKFVVNSADLVSVIEVKNKISDWLKINETIDIKNDQIKYRLLPTSKTTFLPVYWIYVKPTLNRSGMNLIVNAKSSELIYQYSNQKHLNSSIPPVQVFDGRFHILKTNKTEDQIDQTSAKYKNICQMISTNKKSEGEPLLIHIDQCDIGKDTSASRAENNIKNILNYYLSEHSQYGFDNAPENKTTIKSLVHAGVKFDNAYWDEDLKIMVYGDGQGGIDKNATNDYTLALDIAGHEFTHAIVSNTANLMAASDAGAMNEAFADIFGILISRKNSKFANWNIGAKLYNNADGDSDEIALRSLSSPEKFKTSTLINGQLVQVPFPEKYSERLAKNEKCDDENDLCEVHANSTIFSHAAYLIDESFQNNLKMSASEADQKMAKLYFITLTHKLRENETMMSAAKALFQTCTETLTAPECDIVKAAFIQTEIWE